MKTPFFFRLSLSFCLVLGTLPGSAFGRGNDAEVAVKAAEARLRASSSPSLTGKARSSAEHRSSSVSVASENFFAKLAARFTRPAAPSKASAGREMPVVTVRESRAAASKAAPATRHIDGGDLRELVSGIVSRLGPMQLEYSDDAVLNPPSDSLALLNHPNIRPTVPVAPVPAPGRSGRQAPAPNPLTEQRTSWLAAKVAERLKMLEDVEQAMLAEEPARAPVPVLEPVKPSRATRESIELMAILAVSGRASDDSIDPVVADRSPGESRISALSLLAAATEGAPSAEAPAPISSRPSALRELPRFPGSKLEPIPVIRPAQEIDAASRSRVLVLLKPDNFAASQ